MGAERDRSNADVGSAAARPSIAAAFVAWLLIWVPIGRLAVTARNALASSLPISRRAALVVVIIVAVGGVLLARDFRPTILGGVAFHALYLLLQVSLLVAARALFVPEATLTPPQQFAVDSLSIAIALAVVFTETSRRVRRRIRTWARPYVRKLLRLPPRDGSDDRRERP